MNFTKHFNLEGRHAPFSPSQPAWLNYTDEKAMTTLNNLQAKKRGTELHEWAKKTIDLKIKQPRSNKTIYAYVNDAIGYKMETEVVLYYSDYFFGTADAICFRKNKLRIHDLKTGKGSVHMEQLLVYAALFCLEYKIKPNEILVELRIYQNDEIIVYEPESEEIKEVMDKIKHLDNLISQTSEV